MPAADPPPGSLAQALLFQRELTALLHRVAPWSPSRWRAHGWAGAAADLAAELARLGRRAGSGAPGDAAPGAVAPHGLADQLAVLGTELLDLLAVLPGPQAHAVAAAGIAAVRAADL